LEDVNALGYRERQDNVFNAMRTVFVSPSLQEILRARSSVEVDHDMFKKWVEENIPRQFPMPLSLAGAFDGLSRADIFDGRIFRRQHYGFLKYSGDLSASVGLHTNERAHGFISYQFPTILKRLSIMKGSAKKSLVKKIQSHVRGSRSRILQEVVFYAPILESSPHAAEWVSALELDEDELAYLLQATPASAKVKKLLKAAEEWKESHSPRPRSTHSSREDAPAESSGSKSKKKGKDKEVVPEKPSPSPPESKKQTSLSTFFG
jgi:replication factor C large subunit